MSRRYKKRKYSRKSFASRVKSIAASVVKKNSETFYTDTEYNASNIQDNLRIPLDTSLNAVAHGDGPGARTGNQIRVSGMYGKLAFAAGSKTSVIRYIMYIPKAIGNTLSLDGLDVYEPVDQDKYTVLHDKLITVSNLGPATKVLSIRKKFNKGSRSGILTQFESNSATSFTRNQIRLYMVSDSIAATDPEVTGHIRLYYKDL